jgi:hypothetical protein
MRYHGVGGRGIAVRTTTEGREVRVGSETDWGRPHRVG